MPDSSLYFEYVLPVPVFPSVEVSFDLEYLIFGQKLSGQQLHADLIFLLRIIRIRWWHADLLPHLSVMPGNPSGLQRPAEPTVPPDIPLPLDSLPLLIPHINEIILKIDLFSHLLIHHPFDSGDLLLQEIVLPLHADLNCCAFLLLFLQFFEGFA